MIGVRKTASFCEFSLCLSRACLGKLIVFIYKWLKNAVFRSQVGRGVSHCGVNESSFLRCCFLDAENIDCLPRQARDKRSFAKTGSNQNMKDSLSSSHTWYAIVGNADPQEASDGCIAPSCQTVGVMSDTAPSSPCPSTIMSRNCACTVATPSTCRHKTPLFFECFPYVCPEPVLV